MWTGYYNTYPKTTLNVVRYYFLLVNTNNRNYELENTNINSSPPCKMQRKSSFTSHHLLHRRKHDQDSSSIEARMWQSSTKFTAFLTKSTPVAEKVCSKITSWLTLFTLLIIFHNSSTASTWPAQCFTASLQIKIPANSCTARIRKPRCQTVPTTEKIAKEIKTAVWQAMIGKRPRSWGQPFNIATIQQAWSNCP